MKKDFIKITTFVAIIVVIIGFVNYYVDSYAELRVTYKMIGEMSTETNYCLKTSMSERKAKWAKVNAMSPVEYMILGSSRSMLFSSDNLSISSFYNMGISGGCTVSDYYAETYILYHQGKLPEKMLIEISPAIFNATTGKKHSTAWGNSYDYMKRLLNGEDVNEDDSYLLGIQIKDALSLVYFQYNFKQLLKGGRVCVISNDEADDETLATQHIDGSYAYSRVFQSENDEAAVLESIEDACEQRNIFACSEFNELDAGLIEEFTELIDFLKKNNVSVSIYLPPYSKPMYEYICADDYYQPILEVEDWVLNYAKENNIQVYGSYNPEECGLELDDLYDGYHIKDYKVVDTLWARNLGLTSDWLVYTQETQ